MGPRLCMFRRLCLSGHEKSAEIGEDDLGALSGTQPRQATAT